MKLYCLHDLKVFVNRFNHIHILHIRHFFVPTNYKYIFLFIFQFLSFIRNKIRLIIFYTRLKLETNVKSVDFIIFI